MPSKDEILNLRKRAGLTQTQAGALIFAPLRTWQDWEYGKRNMPAAKYELFKLKLKEL